MLIEFKVSNYRSIREQQTFSLVASADTELPDCVIERKLPGMTGVRFLKGAAVYGANASGKSNIVEAMAFLKRFVVSSVAKMEPGEPTGTVPFKLDQTSASEPSVFEITFVVDDVRYLFGTAITSTRVLEEYLVAYPKGVAQRWYQRIYQKKTGNYKWNLSTTHFKDGKGLCDMARENALFLSVGAQFNHPKLTKVYSWFRQNCRLLDLGSNSALTPQITLELLELESGRDLVLSLLRNADIGIADVLLKKTEMSLSDIFNKQLKKTSPFREQTVFFPEDTIISPTSSTEKVKQLELNLAHQGDGVNTVSLDFNEESAGTRRYFEILGPWLDTLENGYTVVIDEIETSLHPILVKELLKMIFSAANAKGAQIIFTTHNPILLDNDLMRRDQIWFTEKTKNGTTHLYPLTDYSPRKDEALAKGYLAGRYGGIPFIPDGLL